MAAIFYKNVINIDKLTQGVTLICLLIDFPRLAILLFGLLIKEFLELWNCILLRRRVWYMVRIGMENLQPV